MAGLRSGSVALPSGRWNWTAEPRQGGWFLIFRDSKDADGDMRTWIQAAVLSGDVVRGAALDPLTRRWSDGWGRRWEITIELGSRYSTGGERETYLRFSRMGERYHADIPADLRLGELTRGDLARLLKVAGGGA